MPSSYGASVCLSPDYPPSPPRLCGLYFADAVQPHRFPAVGLYELHCLCHWGQLRNLVQGVKAMRAHLYRLGLCFKKNRKKGRRRKPLEALQELDCPPPCEQQGLSAFSIQQAVFPSGVADPAWHAPCCWRLCQLSSPPTPRPRGTSCCCLCSSTVAACVTLESASAAAGAFKESDRYKYDKWVFKYSQIQLLGFKIIWILGCFFVFFSLCITHIFKCFNCTTALSSHGCH